MSMPHSYMHTYMYSYWYAAYAKHLLIALLSGDRTIARYAIRARSGMTVLTIKGVVGILLQIRAYSETSLIRHSMGPENNVGLGGCWIMECLLP